MKGLKAGGMQSGGMVVRDDQPLAQRLSFSASFSAFVFVAGKMPVARGKWELCVMVLVFGPSCWAVGGAKSEGAEGGRGERLMKAGERLIVSSICGLHFNCAV